MCWTASIASRFSVRLTGRPASRSSMMKPLSRSRSAAPARSAVPSGGPARGEEVSESVALTAAGSLVGREGAAAPLERRLLGRELLHDLGDVGLVLEQDVR